MDAAKFLQWLRPSGPWVLTAIIPDGDARTATLSEINGFVVEHDGTRNLYYALNPIKRKMSKKASKADIAAAEFLHADCDPEDDETPEQAKARIMALAETFQPRPSAAIDSGNGVQLLWRLEEPIEPLAAEPYNKSLLAAFRAHAGTQNCDRILRLPGTINLPNARKRSVGRVECQTAILWLEDTRYPISAFPMVSPAEEAREEQTKSAGQQDTAHIDSFTIDTLTISDELKKIIREGCYERWKGDRSRAVFHVARELLKASVPDSIIARILRDPKLAISEHVLRQTPVDRAIARTLRNARTSNESFVKDTKSGKIYEGVAQNVRVAVAQLGIAFAYCEFSDRILLTGLDGFGPELDDHAVNRIWLLIDERFKFRPGKDFLRTVVIDDAVTNHRVHPVKDYLASLTWDGTPRLDTWLINYAGAADTPFVRAVGRLALIAAVRRVRSPGCKFDELLVLESPTQGTDKSTAIETIAIREGWFTDCLPLNAEPKVAIEQTRGIWIAEAGELSGMRKADIDKLKNFLSRKRDRGRLAYGHLTSDVPRQFIAIGTTNNREYLKDQTGNRRFWPVAIERFDVARLRADRDQLWAEASSKEAAGASIRLDPSLWAAAGIEQDERTTTDPYTEIIADHLDRYDDAKIAASDVWKLLGNPKAAQRTQDQNARMGEAMRRAGFGRPRGGKMIWISGKLTSGYVRGAGTKTLIVVTPPMLEGVQSDPYVMVDDGTPPAM